LFSAVRLRAAVCPFNCPSPRQFPAVVFLFTAVVFLLSLCIASNRPKTIRLYIVVCFSRAIALSGKASCPRTETVFELGYFGRFEVIFEAALGLNQETLGSFDEKSKLFWN
jgi:hypothetical protein